MTGLFNIIVDLVKLGNLGVGVAIFVLGFMLVRQTAPVDPETSKLRRHFLWIGGAYAFLAALMTLAPLLIKGSAISTRLAFSPDFETQKLQPPKVRLPDGTVAQHDAKFDLQPSEGTQVVTVAMDGTLDQVRNLRQASANLTSTVAKVTKQRDALATKAAAITQTSESQPKTPALRYLEQNSVDFGAIQVAFSKSLTAGDYVRANQLTGHLQTSVNAAEPAVAVLAKQPTEPE